MMMTREQSTELAGLFADFSNAEGEQETAVPSLTCIKTASPSQTMPTVYNPSFCLVASGRKEVRVGDKLLSYGGGNYIIASVDMAVTGCVVQASADDPYLCLKIDLDRATLSDLAGSLPPAKADPAPRTGLFIGDADEPLGDAVLRLARLMTAPQDIAALAPLIVREIHYRLLTGGHGPEIAAIASKGTVLQRLSGAVQLLKEQYQETISIETLCDVANMSASSFHHHFKELTGHSPIQYQKKLRLNEARKIMLAEGLTASGAAWRVGYESPAQFSRDYARLFGNPPARDIKRLQPGADNGPVAPPPQAV